MHIVIDPNSKTAIYRQIETWIRQNIQNGNLPAGMRLPSSRALAADMDISRITVKNAYDELASDGLVISREGSGTYVADTPFAHSPEKGASQTFPQWQSKVGNISRSPMLLWGTTKKPRGMISFTGVTDSRLFAIQDFSRCLRQVLRRDGTDALEYENLVLGYLPLRQTITHILASQGIQGNPDQILITSGSQQAISLVCQLLVEPGDPILVEKPTYNFALELFRGMRLKIIDIPIDENGMQVEKIPQILEKQRPALIYTIPNFQNPSGTSMNAARRRQLLALADHHNIPILEDDYAGDLRYEGRSQPAIKALDPGGRVIYAGTFSKMVMPGLRTGYLMAEGPVFERLVRQKYITDLSCSSLMQRTLNHYVTLGRYQSHLRRTIRLYRFRRDAMLEAAEQYLPDVRIMQPVHGGLFLWMQLPAGISSSELLTFSRDEGVEFTPGEAFFANPEEGRSWMRLNFTVHSPIEINRGIKRLRQALKRYN